MVAFDVDVFIPSLDNCSLSKLLHLLLLLYYNLTICIGPLLKEHVEFLESFGSLEVLSSLLQHFVGHFPRIENLKRQVDLMQLLKVLIEKLLQIFNLPLGQKHRCGLGLMKSDKCISSKLHILDVIGLYSSAHHLILLGLRLGLSKLYIIFKRVFVFIKRHFRDLGNHREAWSMQAEAVGTRNFL